MITKPNFLSLSTFSLKPVVLFAVLTWAFAVPVQAAQRCEAEINELMRFIAAGAKEPFIFDYVPKTRAQAVKVVKEYEQYDCDSSAAEDRQKIIEKTKRLDSLEEKYSKMSPEEFAKSGSGSRSHHDKTLLGFRAILADDKLRLCAKEANNAKKCKGSKR